jgi:diacylglycerol kinase (ATP)
VSTRKGWGFVVNPIAGNGYAAECEGTARLMMQRHGAQGEVALTRGKGHATELAAAFVERGFAFVIAVGGDGTMSETAQALVGHADVAFGGVAAGTGNDFIHVLGFPDRFADAHWATLFRARTAAMDVGRCNGRYFLNGMGLGVDAQIAYENYHMENGAGVRKGSKSKYTWHIVKNILLYKERPVRVTMGAETIERSNFLNTIANGRRLAGGLHLTPRALADDGRLDICMTTSLSVPARFGLLSAVKRQAHVGLACVEYSQVESATFEYQDEVPAHLDGELIFARRFEIDVAPRALRAIIDPEGGHYFGA